MAEISLVVTQAVLDHVSRGNESQSQIAMRAPSQNIKSVISQLDARNQKTIVLGGGVRLIVGDPGAIWLAHNSVYKDDFLSLFTMLSRRPGQAMRFLCEIE
jgi:hypothetical protein